MRRGFVWVIAGMALLGSASTATAAKDPAKVARNVIPSGQWGAVPAPPGADSQAKLYDGLTPLFDQVTRDDLGKYFKSQRFGVGTDGPATPEAVPRPGVEILRDRYNVPHVKADTYEDGIWAAGWIAAADRRLLGELARYNSRVAAIDAPGLTAVGLLLSLQNFEPSAETEAEVARQTRVLRRQGREGRAVLRDIDTFISGINDFISTNNLPDKPWTRNDVYAVNALKGQFVGQGGGDEARRSEFLSGLQARLGATRGLSVFDDLRQFKNRGAATSVDGRFPYGRLPGNKRGNVVFDSGSFERTAAVSRQTLNRLEQPPEPSNASNTLMINKSHSTSNRPLMVGGPQIGYNYPGFTYEIDMDAPGLQWRGATSAPFPGYLLIGRGVDFATTLTSSAGDIIDQFAEKLCGGSDRMYKYKGKCREMERFNAGTLDGEPVVFDRTVHGPVVGYGTSGGQRYAIASKRSSYGRDTVDQIFYRRLSTGRVHNPRTFFNAANKTPQTFNSFYIDAKNVAMFGSGRMPIRHRHVDPGLPTKGTGRFEWRGFLPKKRHIHGKNPKDGTMTNWNNVSARGFGASDGDWGGNGSAARVDLLDYNLDRLRKRKNKWDLASVTSAMNAAATQDVRAIDTVPLLRRLLRGTNAPTEQAQRMVDLLGAWRANGGNRLDRDGDGLIDDPGAAIMDGAWNKIANAFMRPLLGPQLDELNSFFRRFDQPPSGQYNGWYQYFDRDIRALLGMRVEQPFRNSYCGGGNLQACQEAIWDAIAEAGAALAAEQGTADPATWRSSAADEAIRFSPVNVRTMAYTNRPSGIQQVISFKR